MTFEDSVQCSVRVPQKTCAFLIGLSMKLVKFNHFHSQKKCGCGHIKLFLNLRLFGSLLISSHEQINLFVLSLSLDLLYYLVWVEPIFFGSTGSQSWIQDFSDWGRQPQRWGCQPIIWLFFSRKLLENERNWTQRGISRPLTPSPYFFFEVAGIN